MDYTQLKDRHRAARDAWHPNLSLRVHRALSWLDRAEQLGGQHDADGQFILLWIAFNAAYATEIDEKYRDSEQQTFRGFLDKLTQLDAGKKRFDTLAWTEFPKSIRVLLDNPYVYADFWRFQNGTLPEAVEGKLRGRQQGGARGAGPTGHGDGAVDRAVAHLHAAQPADSRRGHLERVGQSRAAEGLREPDGETGTAGNRGDDGSPGNLVGGCGLSGCDVRGRVLPSRSSAPWNPY